MKKIWAFLLCVFLFQAGQSYALDSGDFYGSVHLLKRPVVIPSLQDWRWEQIGSPYFWVVWNSESARQVPLILPGVDREYYSVEADWLKMQRRHQVFRDFWGIADNDQFHIHLIDLSKFGYDAISAYTIELRLPSHWEFEEQADGISFLIAGEGGNVELNCWSIYAPHAEELDLELYGLDKPGFEILKIGNKEILKWRTPFDDNGDKKEASLYLFPSLSRVFCFLFTTSPGYQFYHEMSDDFVKMIQISGYGDDDEDFDDDDDDDDDFYYYPVDSESPKKV
jgi:hypothetical protein